MRTQSDIRPQEFEMERHGETTELIFRENISEETEEREGESAVVYVYDEYRLTVPDRGNLREVVEAAESDWRAAAQAAEYDALAAAIREKRDALLKDTDREMTLDRLGLDVSSAAKFIASLAGIFTGAWAQYRQALRDVPQQPGFPYEVEFPTPPEEGA